ncbi:MAG: ribonuclease [Clostridiales bacterium]|nr:ribonuclease [Clostridiales bacterium]
MGKKVYAVRKGFTTGLFYNWDECKKSIYGFKGAEYKGFESKSEAQAFLEVTTPEVITTLEYRDDILVAYVDGSYNNDIKRYGFGCVLITPDGEIIREFGAGDDPESAAIRNVAGELLGAMFATKWAIKNEYKAVEIRHDYEGIAKWITGDWKAKNEMVQKYVKVMNQFKASIAITFVKVKAHSNEEFNEEADRLAKEAVATGIKNTTV